MKLSKQYKAEHYDQIASDKSTLEIALYDLVNGKFTPPVTIKESVYVQGAKDSVSVRLSWRAMPLFLVQWRTPNSDHYHVTVLTEEQMDDVSREACHGSVANMMLRDAFVALKRTHYPQAA